MKESKSDMHWMHREGARRRGHDEISKLPDPPRLHFRGEYEICLSIAGYGTGRGPIPGACFGCCGVMGPPAEIEGQDATSLADSGHADRGPCRRLCQFIPFGNQG